MPLTMSLACLYIKIKKIDYKVWKKESRKRGEKYNNLPKQLGNGMQQTTQIVTL